MADRNDEQRNPSDDMPRGEGDERIRGVANEEDDEFEDTEDTDDEEEEEDEGSF
jgi:hypothetical protein